MIHLALWIASFLFLCAIAIVIICAILAVFGSVVAREPSQPDEVIHTPHQWAIAVCFCACALVTTAIYLYATHH